ncbi:hypothetical protein KJ695_02550, partial [Patescibacteria group bacterium]|nr:hypothetical protein [Patescibacteria group bacterium]
MKKTNLKIIGVSVAVFVSAVLIFNGLNFRGGINKTDVKAAATDNILGYAWSENIGWISFNCTNTSCATSNYGVNLNFGTGNLSGYAWSENIGWVSFNAVDVTGCPANTPRGDCLPYYDSVTADLFGWARALAYGGGWDGWISLNCLNSGVCAASNYKVSLSGLNFTGYASGGDVVGWLKFNPAFGGVYLANT